MSERKIITDFLKRGATFILSTVTGVIISGVLLLLSAFFMYSIGAPTYLSGFFSLFSLGVGCMASGYICGRIKKHSGLKLGFCCAVIFLCVCAAGALVSGSLNGTDALAKCLTTVITGCTGGVIGVNRT